MRTCKASGCHRQTRGFGAHCNRHYRNLARHGHPHQIGIHKRDLQPYLKEVRKFLQRPTSSDPSGIAAGIWSRTVEEARSFVRKANQGRPFNRHEFEAHKAILSLADQQDALKVAETLLAMGFWYEFDKRFWRFDDGFRFQTVRMLLRLNPKEATYKWSDGKMTRSVYREVSPHTTRVLWAVIVKTGLVNFGGGIAAHTAKLAEAKQRRAEEERHAFFGGDPEVSA